MWVIDKGFSKVEVECDLPEPMTSLNSGDQILSKLSIIVNDIHLLNLNISVQVGHMPREYNNLAHDITEFEVTSSISMC